MALGWLSDTPLAGLAVALGGGLLIGLERERHKGHGALRGAAGMRSFALAALVGALAQSLAQPLLVAAGALAVLVLAGVAYWWSRSRSTDPGLTTELALFTTYLIGVLAVDDALLSAGAAVVVVVLLAGRDRMHRFATRALSEGELHDALLLGALALVMLPTLPSLSLPWLLGANPRSLLLLVVLILALQGAGHIGLRLLGPRAGFAIGGLCGGLVSSAATIASMGSRVRGDARLLAGAGTGAVMSTCATWLLAQVLVTALSPPLGAALLLPALAGGLTAAASGLLWLRAVAPGERRDGATATSDRGPLRVREAAIVAVLLTVISLAVSQAHRVLGEAGVVAGVMTAALADSHAAVSAVAALHARGELDTAVSLRAVVLAIAANAAVRGGVAFIAGGPAFGRRVSLSLLASTLAAATVAFVRV